MVCLVFLLLECWDDGDCLSISCAFGGTGIQRLNQKQEYFDELLTCLFQELVELSLDEVLVSLSLVTGEGDEGDGQADSSPTVLIIVRSTGSSTCP